MTRRENVAHPGLGRHTLTLAQISRRTATVGVGVGLYHPSIQSSTGEHALLELTRP